VLADVEKTMPVRTARVDVLDQIRDRHRRPQGTSPADLRRAGTQVVGGEHRCLSLTVRHGKGGTPRGDWSAGLGHSTRTACRCQVVINQYMAFIAVRGSDFSGKNPPQGCLQLLEVETLMTQSIGQLVEAIVVVVIDRRPVGNSRDAHDKGFHPRGAAVMNERLSGH